MDKMNTVEKSPEVSHRSVRVDPLVIFKNAHKM